MELRQTNSQLGVPEVTDCLKAVIVNKYVSRWLDVVWRPPGVSRLYGRQDLIVRSDNISHGEASCNIKSENPRVSP